MTFGNNITEANCYDYHNDYHYCSTGMRERMCDVENVDMKHLVMTGKEHRRPRAVFFDIQARANHFLLFFCVCA